MKVSSGLEQAHPLPSGPAAVSLRESPRLMNVIFLLITASTIVAGVFLVAFILAVRNGQFDDDKSPAVRILNDPPPTANEIK